MRKVNIWDIEGTWFPAGRRTRVLIGENGAVREEQFCQGYVVIEEGGGIPAHDHPNAESYTILKGAGLMEVDGERQEVKEGDCVFIPSGHAHSLENRGEEELHMMFVYAPGKAVEHWEQELSGKIPPL